MRIAFKADTKAGSFDPARIQRDTEAVVLANLYSTLVTVSNDGLIEPFLASHYQWIGNSIHLKIRRDIKTVDGWEITAKDAEFSLNRIIRLNTNAHGDLKLFLCSSDSGEQHGSTCNGIHAVGDELILTVADERFKPFLLKLLATMDFGVIPERSCEMETGRFEIVDHRNTSGPYYILNDDPRGAFVLGANPNHWLSAGGIPDRLEFIPASPEGSLQLLEQGVVDYVPGINVEPSQKLSILKENKELSFFETMPIRKLIIASCDSRRRQFSIEERHALFEKIRNAFFNDVGSTGWERSLDFYPSLGEGALDEVKERYLKQIVSQSLGTSLHRRIKLGATKARFHLFQRLFLSDPMIEVVQFAGLPALMPENERPDFYITATDSSFLESFSLVSYNVLAEQIDLSKTDSAEWLHRYLSKGEKSDRVKMLQVLNMQTLSKGVIGVIGEAPYTDVMRKPFRYDGSPFFVGVGFWQIRKD